MIGFNSLGQLGRLGNQMFQYASLKGIASNRGYDICIPTSQNKDEWVDHQLNAAFKMSTLNHLNYQYIDSNRPIITESDFCFDKKLFNECPEWVNLHGFFQSEKYFKHIRDQLLIDFEFRDNILEPAKEVSRSWNDPISLHIRRTDYVTNPNHVTLGLDYYEKSLSYFDDDCDVIIFSDDPQWCLQQKLFDSDRFLVSETNNNHLDLCLMTLCSSHIIANSSFSWWGAWLSNSQKIIAPSGWFKGSNNSHLDTKDLIPENWIVI
jgi:Glycosyl transferase family 11